MRTTYARGAPKALERSGTECGQRGVHHRPDAVPDGPLVDVEPRLVDVERHVRTRDTGTEPEHRTRYLLQVEREVLAAHADVGLDHAVGAERGGRGTGDDGGRHPVVDDRRDAPRVCGRYLCTTAGDELSDEQERQVGQCPPRPPALHPRGPLWHAPRCGPL